MGSEAPPPPPAPPALNGEPGDNQAIVIYGNLPEGHCGACEKIKISLAPSGKVLIERTYLTGEARYKRRVVHVSPARAAAFAASLNPYRPAQNQAKARGLSCAGTGAEDGVRVEWLEAGRHDELIACSGQNNSATMHALHHAPDVLGLDWLVFPWGTTP